MICNRLDNRIIPRPLPDIRFLRQGCCASASGACDETNGQNSRKDPSENHCHDTIAFGSERKPKLEEQRKFQAEASLPPSIAEAPGLKARDFKARAKRPGLAADDSCEHCKCETNFDARIRRNLTPML
jgi:hypothetical protein